MKRMSVLALLVSSQVFSQGLPAPAAASVSAASASQTVSTGTAVTATPAPNKSAAGDPAGTPNQAGVDEKTLVEVERLERLLAIEDRRKRLAGNSPSAPSAPGAGAKLPGGNSSAVTSSPELKVLVIYGVDGKLSADLTDGMGHIKTVVVGQQFDGKTVELVSLEGVILRTGKHQVRLSMADFDFTQLTDARPAAKPSLAPVGGPPGMSNSSTIPQIPGLTAGTPIPR